MKINPMTEKKCRNFKVPYFDSINELKEFIESLDVLDNDYGTAAYAMSLAGVAAFNYIANKFDCTGFQASCADLDMIRKIRGIDGPFILLKAEDLLYPQYNLREKLEEFIESTKAWQKEKAKNLIKKNDSKNIHEKVLRHWKEIANED